MHSYRPIAKGQPRSDDTTEQLLLRASRRSREGEPPTDEASSAGRWRFVPQLRLCRHKRNAPVQCPAPQRWLSAWLAPVVRGEEARVSSGAVRTYERRIAGDPSTGDGQTVLEPEIMETEKRLPSTTCSLDLHTCTLPTA